MSLLFKQSNYESSVNGELNDFCCFQFSSVTVVNKLKYKSR